MLQPSLVLDAGLGFKANFSLVFGYQSFVFSLVLVATWTLNPDQAKTNRFIWTTFPFIMSWSGPSLGLTIPIF